MEYFDEDLFGDDDDVEEDIETRRLAYERAARVRELPGRLVVEGSVTVAAAAWLGTQSAIGAAAAAVTGVIVAAGIVAHAVWPRKPQQPRPPKATLSPARGPDPDWTPPPMIEPVSRRAVVFAYLGPGSNVGDVITDLCGTNELPIERLVLLHHEDDAALAANVASALIVGVDLRPLRFSDPHSHDEIRATIDDVIATHPFETSLEDYFVHVNHRAGIPEACLMLMAQTGQIPGKLIWSSLSRPGVGTYLTHRMVDVAGVRVVARSVGPAGEEKLVLQTKLPGLAKSYGRLEEAAELGLSVALVGETGSGKSEIAAWLHRL